MSTSDFQRQPETMEIRVIDRDGRRLLQQYRRPADGMTHEQRWVDVAELGPLPSTVRALRRKD